MNAVVFNIIPGMLKASTVFLISLCSSRKCSIANYGGHITLYFNLLTRSYRYINFEHFWRKSERTRRFLFLICLFIFFVVHRRADQNRCLSGNQPVIFCL